MRTSVGKGIKLSGDESAFTILELLVATAIGTLITALLVGNVLTNQQAYHEDVVRTRINSNLRSALDIVSMNIRQAGENLQDSFPAVQVINGTGGASDVLVLRRARMSEVLTICEAVSIGETQLDVSDSGSSAPECFPANAINVLTRINDFRNDQEIRAYLYNTVTKVGEFVDFTGSGTSGGEHYVTVSGPTQTYPSTVTALYILEEYRFELNATNDTLQLTVDGLDEEPRPVAFSVVGFDVAIERNDGTVEQELTLASSWDWKDISEIGVRLTGREERRNRVIESNVAAGFFPRNVLSE